MAGGAGFAAVGNIKLTTHSGTHFDAPWHFHPTQDAASGEERPAMNHRLSCRSAPLRLTDRTTGCGAGRATRVAPGCTDAAIVAMARSPHPACGGRTWGWWSTRASTSIASASNGRGTSQSRGNSRSPSSMTRRQAIQVCAMPGANGITDRGCAQPGAMTLSASRPTNARSGRTRTSSRRPPTRAATPWAPKSIRPRLSPLVAGRQVRMGVRLSHAFRIA